MIVHRILRQMAQCSSASPGNALQFGKKMAIRCKLDLNDLSSSKPANSSLTVPRIDSVLLVGTEEPHFSTMISPRLIMMMNALFTCNDISDLIVVYATYLPNFPLLMPFDLLENRCGQINQTSWGRVQAIFADQVFQESRLLDEINR